MVAAAEPGGEDRMARRHARSVALRRFGALECRKLFFELSYGGIGYARVDESLVIPAVARRKARYLFRREGRRHHEIRRRCARDGIHRLAGMHRGGAFAPLFRIIVGHVMPLIW